MNHRVMMILMLAGLFLAGFAGSARAEPEPFDALDSEGVEASREGRILYLHLDAGVAGPILIPRLAAPLRAMRWDGAGADAAVNAGLTIKPQQDVWEIRWKDRPDGPAVLIVEFDAAVRLPSEVEPVAAAGDGSFFLPAHLAVTRGQTIRYEPQPNKNTVGFWRGEHDTATWTVDVQEPGRYSVAILQGCGRGQGGSTATITLRPADESAAGQTQGEADEQGDEQGSDPGHVPGAGAIPGAVTLEFAVQETGHFQNFQWRHLGEIELNQTGAIEVTLAAVQISKAALMDARAIHLVRLPDPR